MTILFCPTKQEYIQHACLGKLAFKGYLSIMPYNINEWKYSSMHS